MNAALVSAPQPPEIAQAAKPADKATEKKPAENKADVPVVAGWNGEHLSSRAPTASFKCSRTGTFSLITAPTRGTELPRTRFSSRARFGFQGTFGTHYDYAVLIDSAASNGISLRDLYVNIKPNPAFLFQVGQYKEPFAQNFLPAPPIWILLSGHWRRFCTPPLLLRTVVPAPRPIGGCIWPAKQ